jgi:hypothetical protein
MSDLTQEEVEQLQDKIDWEGFDYCFIGYSNWKEIQSTKFHNLLRDMVESRKAFIDFLIKNGIDADEF